MIDKFKNLALEMFWAGKMAATPWELLKLAWWTGWFHLDNKSSRRSKDAFRTLSLRLGPHRLELSLRQNPGDLWTLYEVFGQESYLIPVEDLPSVRTVVDLGAHIGLSTLYLSRLFPQARFLCVEPNPSSLPFLKCNLEQNGVAHKILPVGIGKEDAKARKLYAHHCTSQFSLLENPLHGAAQEVKIMTMGSLCEQEGIAEIDLLKVDIEGAEAELLADGERWLPRVRAIIMEIHPTRVHVDALVRRFSQLGFRFFKAGEWAPLYDTFLREDLAATLTGLARPRAIGIRKPAR